MKKIAYLLVFMVIALSALGLGYAGWSKNLSVVGTITPGIFDARIDLEAPYLVSSAEYATIEEGASTDTSLVINISGAAAGNTFTVHYILVNEGTIPANVTFAAPVIVAVGTGANSSDISANTPTEPLLLEGAGSLSNELTITLNDSTPMNGNVSYTINIGITAAPP